MLVEGSLTIGEEILNILTKFKEFPYKTTCVVGVIYLLNWFIAGLKPNTWEIIGLPLLLYLLTSLVWNLVVATATERSSDNRSFQIAFGRLLLCIVIFCLTFPVARLGHYLKTQIFLFELPRYQQLADKLVEKEKSRSPTDNSPVIAPEGYSDLGFYWVAVNHEENGVVAVDFLTDDYGFPPRHRGYVYVSNDDPASLKKDIEYRNLFLFRVAPHWYGWID